MRKQFYLVCFICLGFHSCNFFDSADEVPMYLNLSEASLTANFGQGSNTHKITDAWVFVDGKEIGVFEIPIVVPILNLDDDDMSNITIFAGVRANGILSDAILYPFYEQLDFEIPFVEETTVDLNLDFEYIDDAQFEFIEGFENGNIFNLDVDGDLETTIVVDQNDAASGNSSAQVNMTAGLGTFEASTASFLDKNLIPQGSKVFLEIDYKNSIELQIGLITIEGNLEFKTYKLVLLPKDEWNKVYVDFTNELAGSIELYKPVFGIINPTEEDRVVRFDNVKLIHF